MKKRTDTKVKIVTTVSHELKVSHHDMVAMLRKMGYKVPEDCHIKFVVPSGGDYSGEELPLAVDGHEDGDNCKLVIRWEEKR